jgi:hypothetical protein
MNYQLLLEASARAERGDKNVLLGQRVTRRLKQRIETAAKASGLEEAQVIRAAIELVLPALDGEDGNTGTEGV